MSDEKCRDSGHSAVVSLSSRVPQRVTIGDASCLPDRHKIIVIQQYVDEVFPGAQDWIQSGRPAVRRAACARCRRLAQEDCGLLFDEEYTLRNCLGRRWP